MRKMEKRAMLCLVLALCLFLGMGFYVYKQVTMGGTWVAYPANQNIYTNGYIATGSIYDRNGTLLMENNETGVPTYSDDYNIRVATLHAVGDNVGNISTGANVAFSDKLVGYNFIFGTFSTNNNGRNLYLSIDADVCAAANQALAGRNGTVGVYNYETGEIVCMVSSPNYDPTNPPTVSQDDTSGIYLNKFLSASVVPGSIFKVITATAAIEKLDNLDSWTYTCPGQVYYGDSETEKVTCPYNHGTQTFEDVLANSCNCGFAELTLMIGPRSLSEYVEKAGLTDSYYINGIPTVPGSFDFPSEDVTLAWTGIGQHQDLVNPCSMMVYMGAIANGGKTKVPTLINRVTYVNGWPAGLNFKSSTAELIDPDTAAEMDELLHNNVVQTYGEGNFPGLDICAKSGTAENPSGAPHSWFTGYIRNPGYPYAFIVLVENGGSGASTAGSVANTVLQEIIAKPSLASE